MARNILILIGTIAVATGIYMFVVPQTFYDRTPGVEMMGPFNVHFIRDAALAFLASGIAMVWGAVTRNRGVAFAGAAWPLLHALFHIQIWIVRGTPFDFVAGFNFLAVIAPALLAASAASRLKTRTSTLSF
jgi:hypothetical protein